MLTLSRPLTTDFSALRPEIQTLQAELVSWRRAIHQRPELGFQEEITAQFICDRLDEWGISYQRNIAKTGIVATITAPQHPRGQLTNVPRQHRSYSPTPPRPTPKLFIYYPVSYLKIRLSIHDDLPFLKGI